MAPAGISASPSGLRRPPARPSTTKPTSRISGIIAEPTRPFSCEIAASIARRYKQARLDADVRLERFNAVQFVAQAIEDLPGDLEPIIDVSVLNLRARRGDPDYIDTERISIRLSAATDQRLAIAINNFYKQTGITLGRNDLVAIALHRVLP